VAELVSLFGEERRVAHVPASFAELVAAEAPPSIALSGGDTARACYELLAISPVDWSGVDVYFGDERWVPIHDHESNEGMARVTFLDEVEPRAIHSLRNAGPTDEEAAAAYDARLRAAPPLGLVHLGLGPDGHIASLFPGSPTLDETERLVVTAGDDLHPLPRLTVTYPALARAALVVFTVAGADKRDALAAVRRGDDLPASRVRASRVIWLVDDAAAGSA
jgi:6-phosphogluconolactonase